MCKGLSKGSRIFYAIMSIKRVGAVSLTVYLHGDRQPMCLARSCHASQLPSAHKTLFCKGS